MNRDLGVTSLTTATINRKEQQQQKSTPFTTITTTTTTPNHLALKCNWLSSFSFQGLLFRLAESCSRCHNLLKEGFVLDCLFCIPKPFDVTAGINTMAESCFRGHNLPEHQMFFGCKKVPENFFKIISKESDQLGCFPIFLSDPIGGNTSVPSVLILKAVTTLQV